MPNKNKSLYGILGVPRDASEKEIKDAYRKLAMELHPDRNPNDKEKYERFLEISDAYTILSNSEKRREYDSKGSVGKNEGIYQTTSDGTKVDMSIFNDLFDTLFGKDASSIFSTQEPIGFGSNVDWMTGQPIKPKQLKEIFLPENDLGLISALITAYSARSDGEWKVRPASNDDRRWIPKYLYKIKKVEGKVFVFRSVKDWRYESAREREIILKDPSERWREGSERFGPSALFGESFLTGKRNDDFYGEGGVSPVPLGYDNYLRSIKSFAKKVSEGRTDYLPELREVSGFSERGGFRNSRVEGSSL